jgi:hypothetical protein
MSPRTFGNLDSGSDKRSGLHLIRDGELSIRDTQLPPRFVLVLLYL